MMMSRKWRGRTSNGSSLVDCFVLGRPLSSELGRDKQVKARFWPWLEPFSVLFFFTPFKSSDPASTAECGRLLPGIP